MLIANTMQAQEALDSLKRISNSAVHDSIRLRILNEIIELSEDDWMQFNTQLKDLSVQILKKSKDYKTRLLALKSFRDALHNEGVSSSENGKLSKALQLYNQSLEISKKLNEKEDIAYTKVEIAKVYCKQGEYSKAITYFYESLPLFEQLGDNAGIADTYSNMAEIYFERRDFSKAIECLSKAYELYKSENANIDMYKVLYKIAYSYMGLKKYPEAITYFDKSYAVLDSSQRKQEGAKIKYNLANAYAIQANYPKAVKLYNESAELAKEQNYHYLITASYLGAGEVYSMMKDGENSIRMLKNALLYWDASEAIDVKLKIYTRLYITTKAKGNYKEAVQYADSIYTIRTRMFDENIQQNIADERVRYELEKKELQAKAERNALIAELNLDSERQYAKKNQWLIILSSVAILLIILTYFLFRNYRQKNIIAKQKENILQQKLLVSQMNPHFIFNSLNAIQNFIFSNDGLKAGTYLSKFAELIRMILNYSRADFITLKEEMQLLHNYLELQQLRFDDKFDFEINIDEAIDISGVIIPPMLAQPFIENAIEHGLFYKEDKGVIKINIWKDGSYIKYQILDNGIGLTKSAEQKAGKATHQSLATQITKERLGLEKGSLEIEEFINNYGFETGVNVVITLPHSKIKQL